VTNTLDYYRISYDRKNFNFGAIVIKLLCLSLIKVPITLECFSLAGLSSLVKCLLVRPEPTRVENHSVAPLLSSLLALPANIRLGWKGLPRTNTLAFVKIVTHQKICYDVVPGFESIQWLPIIFPAMFSITLISCLWSAESGRILPCCQCYETFYGRNLQMFPLT
jgi:hypothetical protein